MQFTTSTELTQFLDNYRDLYNSDTVEAYEALKIKARGIELPSFYTQREIRKTYTINVETHPEKPFVAKVYDEENNFLKEFFTLSEPYDLVEKEFDVNIKFAG